MEELEYKKLQRASYISATLTLLGFAIVIGSLIFSYNEIRDKEERVNALVKREQELGAQIMEQELRIKELEIASSPQSIIIRNKNLKLKGIFDPQNRQIYDYSIWLEVPILLKDKIEKVVYNFPDKSMLKKERESTEYANGYGVAYRGWGCFSSLEVNVHLNDNKVHILSFDQCTEHSPIKQIK